MSASLADNRPLVSKGWLSTYGIMYLGINIAWAGPSQLLISNQILAWHPENKENLLALIMAIGGFLGLIASPVVGILSDKTRSRFGRRAPWIVGGSVTAALALVAMAFAPNFVILVILWGIFQTVIAAAVNASQAIPPDRVSRRQYGTVSGIMGIGWTLAVVVGTLLGESLSITAAYFASAFLLLALIVPFLIRYNQSTILPTQEPQEEGSALESANRGGLMEAELAGGLNESTTTGLAAYRDFGWVFFSRLTATLGNTVALFYLLYYLRDHIGLDDPDAGVLTLTAVYALITVVTSIWAGRFSDKLGVRKPFVFTSCLGVALACGIMAFAHTFWVVIVAAVVLGIAWGTFTAIDQALINQVLPHAQTRGRDIGYMSLAVATPNLLSPILAAFALSNLGGYAGLYIMAGVLAILGGFSVLNVKSSQ